MEKIYSEAYRLGGITSGEHCRGISKCRYFLSMTARENLDVMNQIKNALDPEHILNEKTYILTKGEQNA